MSTAVEPALEHDPKQTGQRESIEEIKGYGVDGLLKWFNRKRPNILEGNALEKFKEAGINGESFFEHRGDEKWFQTCGLPIATSERLAKLASETFGARESKEQDTSTGKSDDHASEFAEAGGDARRLQANNVTGNRQQAENVVMSDAADMKSPQIFPYQVFLPQQYPCGAVPQPSYLPQPLLLPAQYGPPQQQYGSPGLVTAIVGEGTAGTKSTSTGKPTDHAPLLFSLQLTIPIGKREQIESAQPPPKRRRQDAIPPHLFALAKNTREQRDYLQKQYPDQEELRKRLSDPTLHQIAIPFPRGG